MTWCQGVITVASLVEQTAANIIKLFSSVTRSESPGMIPASWERPGSPSTTCSAAAARACTSVSKAWSRWRVNAGGWGKILG